MKKHHVHTTLSPRHYALLEKYTEKYVTQQKALEFALESLDYFVRQSQSRSPEDVMWSQMDADVRKQIIIMQKDSYKVLLESSEIDTFIGHLNKNIPMEFAIEYFYRKPLREFTLKELMDAIVLKVKIQNTADMINYTDDGDFYSLNISHNLGLNHSKVLQNSKESIFRKYGARFESQITDRSVFIKIYKN